MAMIFLIIAIFFGSLAVDLLMFSFTFEEFLRLNFKVGIVKLKYYYYCALSVLHLCFIPASSMDQLAVKRLDLKTKTREMFSIRKKKLLQSCRKTQSYYTTYFCLNLQL